MTKSNTALAAETDCNDCNVISLRDRREAHAVPSQGAQDLRPAAGGPAAAGALEAAALGLLHYLGKSGDLRHLEALIREIISRDGPASAEAIPPRTGHDKRFRFGKTWLDVEAATLTDAAGHDIPITSMEYNLLKLFARNRGRVLNRDQILEGAHDRSWDPFDRSIDIRISRIRRKIEVNPQKPEAIRTVRGIGYIYGEQSEY
jgi:DNA-binding response OmpR family regulator